MKIFRFVGILFIIFLFPKAGMSQSYTPLLDTFNEWHFTTCYSGCLTDVYYTDGDTVVNGKTYKILDGFHYISRSFLIREDISNQKVYLLFDGPNILKSEILLYDFSIQAGDTFLMENPISPFPPNPGNFICDSIISRPLLDGNNYKHFYFHPIDTLQAYSQNAIWIEGIGSLSLINAPGGEPDVNDKGSLSCFFKDGIQFFQNLDSIEVCLPSFFPNSTELVDAGNKIKLTRRLNSVQIEVDGASFQYQIFENED